MIELNMDIWKAHDLGYWICITTNGVVKANGKAVMGRGVALQCAQRYPDIPRKLGLILRQHGCKDKVEYANHVNIFPEHRIITFPTKHDWRDKSLLSLISRSFDELCDQIVVGNVDTPVFLPRPGCANGQLSWKLQVKPLLESIHMKRPISQKINGIVIVHRERG